MTPPYRSPDKKQIPHFYRFHGPEQFHKVSLFYFFFSSTLPPVSKGRVLIVTYVFPPEEGGVGMAAYEMACSLSSLDWDIHVLTRPLDSPEEPFRSRPYSPLTTLPDTLTKNSARLREYLDGFLKDFRPDVIIYHSWADWCREELLDAARDSGIPFFLRSHGAATNFRSFFRFNYPPFFGLKKWLRSFFQIRRNILNVCRKSPLNRLVFLDPYGTLFKSFDYYCASRSKLAHYSCIPNTFPALKRTAPFFREKYGLSSAPVFTCPAGASMRKRQLLFIRHVKRSRLRHIIFLFLIPQRNAYAEQMEQAIGDDPRFRILYRLPRLEVEAAIMESDAVFLYSYQEQQPLSILEAMSCGVPWFAPDAGALSTLEGGIVLKNASPSALEGATAFFLHPPGRKASVRVFHRPGAFTHLLTLPPFFQSMPTKRLRPVLAIAADLPLGRLLTSFRNKDRRTIPWIFSLFHALESQEDFDIHWITLSKAVSAAETIRMRNQTIHILPLGSMGRNILTAHFLTVRRIRKTLNDIQPDLLHVWGVEQAYALAGITFRGKKLLSYQGALTAYCQRAPQAFLLHMQALWERMAVKHYDFITCESPWACDRVAEIAPHARLSCMEYGVEPSFYHLVRKPSPEPSCLFAGTIYELKGISYLVEAFTHPSLSHVQLFIAGNGALRERLEALSTPNIHWLGSISRAELQQHLSTAWFLVHPTLGDCCPNIVKEARVMGLPVITTEEGGQTQYVQDGVSGYIVPVRNSAAVREAAQKLSVSLDKAMSMGMERHQECRRLLDVKQTVTGCLSRYHTMLYPR